MPPLYTERERHAHARACTHYVSFSLTLTLTQAHMRTLTNTHTLSHTQFSHICELLLCYPSCAKEKSKLSDENFFGLRRFKKHLCWRREHDSRPSIFYSIEKQRQPLKLKPFRPQKKAERLRILSSSD